MTLKHIWQFFTGREAEDDLRAQADDVRSVAKRLRLSAFPEILSEPRLCSTCYKRTLLLVHPYLCCYSCLNETVSESHRDICNRLNLKEPKSSGASFDPMIWQVPYCVVAGLKTLLLVFVLILVAEIVAIATVGFGIVLDSAGSWLVFALIIFVAGFAWKFRKLRKAN